MKKRLTCIALAMLLTAGLAGCAGPGGETSSAPESVGEADQIGDVSVAEGEKRMTDGLDFGGNSYRLAMAYQPYTWMERKIEGFGEKFNADIEISVLNWYEYNTELAAAKASGVPFDIIWYSGDFYPSTMIADILQPLDPYYTTADFYNPDKPEEGGLNETITKSFNWDNKSYVASSVQSVYPEVMYYNKLLFRDSGLEDPMDLYEKGEWTWDNLMTMAHEVTDPANGTYFLSGFGNVTVWLAYNNVNVVTFENGVPRQNLQDEKLISVMNEYRNLYNGQDAVAKEVDDLSEYDNFIQGNRYVYIETNDAWSRHYNDVSNSNAFGRDASNLGAITLPKSENNPEGLATYRVAQGWACGAGSSEPRLAIALAMYESTWVDPEPDESSMPQETRQFFVDALNKGLFANIMGFQDNTGVNAVASVNKDYTNRGFGDKIKMGADVAATLAEYQNSIQKCIVDSTSQQGSAE